jgi:hypothetical protein
MFNKNNNQNTTVRQQPPVQQEDSKNYSNSSTYWNRIANFFLERPTTCVHCGIKLLESQMMQHLRDCQRVHVSITTPESTVKSFSFAGSNKSLVHIVQTMNSDNNIGPMYHQDRCPFDGAQS